MPAPKERQVRKRRNRLRALGNRLRNRLEKVNATVRVLNRRLRNLKSSPGDRAADYLLKFVGKTEQPPGSNDGPFLAAWRGALKTLNWMKGQQWCGFALIAAWQFGGGVRLPDDTVSTVAIANRAARGDGFRKVPFNQIRRGDLLVMHFGSGGPKHVGLALGPARGGVVATVEGNTSPTNSGSQANGGGVFKRTRSLGLVHTVARPS